VKKTLATAVVVLLAIAALGLAGCTSWFAKPITDANKAITDANAHITKFGEADATIQKLQSDLNGVPVTVAGANQALGITAQLRTALGTEKTELDAAKASLSTIKGLDVRKEFKTYADLEITALDTRSKIVDQGLSLYDQMDQMYTAIRDKKASTNLTAKILAEYDKITATIAALTDQAQTQSQAAADYFKAQKLGGN
jgi:hypothetical protein